MTAFYGVNFAKTLTVPPTKIDFGAYGGKVRYYSDYIATTTGMTTADTIGMGKLMPGEMFLGGIIVNVAHGSGRTIKVGDADDDDRYLAAASIATAGNIEMRKYDGFGFRNTTQIPIDLFGTLAGGTLGADAKGLVWMYFAGKD